MTYRSRVERRLRWNRWMLWALILLIGFLIATLTDPLAQAWLPDRADQEHYDRIEGKGWVEVLRGMGHLLTWAFIAIAMLLHDAGERRDRPLGDRVERGARIFGGALLGGLLAEVLKLILRRERPGASDMLYSFKPLEDLLSSSNVGLPSSHTAVAVGGATAVALLLPWSAPLIMLLAVGCGMTRVLVGAHHVSDVYLGIVVGVASGWWVCRMGVRRSALD